MRLSLIEWVLGILSAILLAVVGLQAWKISRLQAKQRTMATNLANFAEANRANVQAIADFKAANAAWATACKANAAANAAALDRLAFIDSSLDAQRARSAADREVFYAQDPHARLWADAGMPAALADRLWPQPGTRPHRDR